MKSLRSLLICSAALISVGACGATFSSASAQEVEKRVALVIGNGNYADHPLTTAVNDAGLMAQTLQAAGFDVVGARDLDQTSLRQAFHDFHDKVAASGPNTVAMIYLNGYGLQFEGDNYFVPLDAKIQSANDVPAEAIRVSDFTKSISDLGLKAEILVLDAGRQNPFQISGPPLASGLALADAQPGTLIAYNASPGTIAQPEQGPYGTYAKSLAEMIRQGGLPLNDVFQQTNLRVNEQSQGAEVPWDDSKVSEPIEFFTLAADAPPPPVSHERMVAMDTQPIKSFTASDAYAAAIERGTMQGYLDFLAAYPDDPMAHRIRAIVAARREATIWHHTWLIDTPPAYWSYLRHYPKGPHVWDAQRRLRELAAAFNPPPTFDEIEYDFPPPPPEEIVIVDRPFIYFGDFDYAPPPPPPPYFLGPPPPAFYKLPPPPPPGIGFFLPVPIFVPMQAWVEHPHNVAPPPPNNPNIYFQNIHNSIVVDVNAGSLKITTPQGQPVAPPVMQPQNGGTQPVVHLPLMAPNLPGTLAKQIQNPNFKQPTVPLVNNAAPATQPVNNNLHQLPQGQQLPAASNGSKIPTPPVNGSMNGGSSQPPQPSVQKGSGTAPAANANSAPATNSQQNKSASQLNPNANSGTPDAKGQIQPPGNGNANNAPGKKNQPEILQPQTPQNNQNGSANGGHPAVGKPAMNQPASPPLVQVPNLEKPIQQQKPVITAPPQPPKSAPPVVTQPKPQPPPQAQAPVTQQPKAPAPQVMPKLDAAGANPKSNPKGKPVVDGKPKPKCEAGQSDARGACK